MINWSLINFVKICLDYRFWRQKPWTNIFMIPTPKSLRTRLIILNIKSHKFWQSPLTKFHVKNNDTSSTDKKKIYRLFQPIFNLWSLPVPWVSLESKRYIYSWNLITERNSEASTKRSRCVNISFFTLSFSFIFKLNIQD